MLLHKFNTASAFKDGIIIRSINKTQANSKCNTVAQCYNVSNVCIKWQFQFRPRLYLHSHGILMRCQTYLRFSVQFDKWHWNFKPIQVSVLCHVNWHWRGASVCTKISVWAELFIKVATCYSFLPVSYTSFFSFFSLSLFLYTIIPA